MKCGLAAQCAASRERNKSIIRLGPWAHLWLIVLGPGLIFGTNPLGPGLTFGSSYWPSSHVMRNPPEQRLMSTSPSIIRDNTSPCSGLPRYTPYLRGRQQTYTYCLAGYQEDRQHA